MTAKRLAARGCANSPDVAEGQSVRPQSEHATFSQLRPLHAEGGEVSDVEQVQPGDGKLCIVLPALNEEEAIGQTVQRCLAARPTILRRSPITSIEIIVVSDGSTDRTAEIASSFKDVETLVFRQNRGYGAAIKCGFAHSDAEFVSFMDADGTCDPSTFAELCRVCVEENADIVLGSRMGPDSMMPKIRRVGNHIFSFILGTLSRQEVHDTASGMRVIRRRALAELYPLPDGLHFTPAMSARALLQGQVECVEVPMSYAEREGRSKLSVARDGLRFLGIMLSTAMCFRPARPLLLLTGMMAFFTVLMGIQPTLCYIRDGRLEEWMIYRFLACLMLGLGGVALLFAAAVADAMVGLVFKRSDTTSVVTRRLRRILSGTRALALAGLLLLAAVGLVWDGIIEYVTLGQVHLHWSRVIVALFLLFMVLESAVTWYLQAVVDVVGLRKDPLDAVRPPDRIVSRRAPGPVVEQVGERDV